MGTRTDQLATSLIAATDAIERELAARCELDRVHGLGPVTRAAIAAGDPVATYYATALWRLTAHREAATHEHLDIADPLGVLSESVVHRAERILQEIVRPSRAVRLAASAIARAASADPLGRWLTIMRSRDISQLPVYDRGTFAGLLTTNGVARWLADHVDENGDALIESARVRDVLPFTEVTETVEFYPVTASVAQILAVLRRVDAPKAVILTASGRDVDPPQGILVRADLGELEAALALDESPAA
ncbi:hypothetical protein [Rarobacter incanus]|uniref:Putative transcriptional regulator n=1 Tax=Rarobacter incanus TaxID=153494 RepID=A0A542SNC1_9MICO|nr:hypothetical protein [Rarobacter incanus]TQK76134.1 putative transcriptional regulator [Rarobacter incanus]